MVPKKNLSIKSGLLAKLEHPIKFLTKNTFLHYIYSILLAVISAQLMIMAFPNNDIENWHLLAFIGMIPIIFVIETQKKFQVILAYFVYLAMLYWSILDWIAFFHPYALPGLVFYVILIHFIPLAVYKFFKRWYKIGSIYNALLFATVMVIFEYSRELGFARFTYGNVAYTQYQFLPLIQIVDITGYLGISYFIYFVNAAIAGWLAKMYYHRPRMGSSFFSTLSSMVLNRFVLIGLLFGLLLFYGNNRIDNQQVAIDPNVVATNASYSNYYYSQSLLAGQSSKPTASTDINLTNKTIKVSLIQHWFDYNLPWTVENRTTLLKKLFTLTRQAIINNPDLVIWSESALMDYYEYRLLARGENPNALAINYYNFFNEIGESYPKTQFLVGSLSLGEINDVNITEKKSRKAKDAKTGSISGNVSKYNSALLINDKGQVIDKSAKMLLVPVGESFPYKSLLTSIPWFAGILEEAQASNFTPFENYKVLNSTKGFFSTLICYEDAFEFLSRILVLHGAEFLVVITNDAWSYSEKSQELHYMFSIFRAIENRRHIVRVGNAGVSGLIDPYGQSSNILPMFKEGISTFEFTPNSSYVSVYTQYGNLFIILIILIFILLIHYSLIMKTWHTYLWIKRKTLKLLKR